MNLLNLDHQSMCDYFLSIGEKSFRATQVVKWLHQHGVLDIAQMTNLSKSLRENLQLNTKNILPEIIHRQQSRDGTCKWLLRLSCGNSVETVFIPEDDRGTLCISSQVGCALNCTFCSTAAQGFNRNLEVAEIIGQLWLAVRELAAMPDNPHRVTNVVMMGMGEPLLNFDNVVMAMNLMMDDNAYGLSKRRVTLSTSGVVPAMQKLAKVSSAALAVSLHAPNDELRNILVPINKKYPLTELMQVCKNFFSEEKKRVVTFEYVMLHNVNDHLQHAKQLLRLLNGVPCKLNLIPFNPYPGAIYQCSTSAAIERFKSILQRAGIVTTVRKTRGDDIDAACGQLVGSFADRTSRRRLLKQKQQAKEA